MTAGRRRDHPVTVVAAEAVTPLIRRVVFGADGLASAFATPSGALGPYVKLVFEHGPERRRARTYSIRHLDPVRDELHVDFVLHACDGPGSAFARAAAPGDAMLLAGPGYLPPAPATRHVVAGDHCALPAIAHVLAHLPADATGTVIVEVPDAAEIQDLAAGTGMALVWLVRGGAEPSRLADALVSLGPPPDHDTMVWAGAEAAIARRIRDHALTTWAVPKARCQVLNYWKAGQPEGGFSYVL